MPQSIKKSTIGEPANHRAIPKLPPLAEYSLDGASNHQTIRLLVGRNRRFTNSQLLGGTGIPTPCQGDANRQLFYGGNFKSSGISFGGGVTWQEAEYWGTTNFFGISWEVPIVKSDGEEMETSQFVCGVPVNAIIRHLVGRNRQCHLQSTIGESPPENAVSSQGTTVTADPGRIWGELPIHHNSSSGIASSHKTSCVR